jgi:hypothetical protein
MRTLSDSIAFAYEVASKHLNRLKLADSPTGTPHRWVDLHLPPSRLAHKYSSELYWDDSILLIEFPFFCAPHLTPSGSVIVSTSKSILPVLSYSAEGDTYYSQVCRLLAGPLAVSYHNLESVRIYMASSLEVRVRVHHQNNDNAEILDVPSLKSHIINKQQSIVRNASEYCDGPLLHYHWNKLDNPGESVFDLQFSAHSQSIVNDRLRPTRYQQSCDSYSHELCRIRAGASTSYCSPRRLAGCTPVAWAMMASSLKKRAYGYDPIRIWPNSACWNIDWSSDATTSDPSQCPEVRQTIWDLHSYLHTSDNGETPGDRVRLGGVFLSNTFHLPYKWGQTQNPSSPTFASVIDEAGGEYPAMYTSTARWKPPETDTDGHCVMVYGYDNSNNSVLACLGWGAFFPDRWITLPFGTDSTMIWPYKDPE